MHRGATSEVESAHLIRPAGRIPGPAGDRVVDNCSPDEHKHHARQHAAPLSHGTGGERDGDGGEHALVDGEEQVGEPRGGDGWGAQHTLEAEVGQVSDEGAGRVREGQRVAPEEPLEGRDGRGHY